ncbi:biotin transporter BioY [Bacillus smithii]|uniref:biotin transporter BioY n=1 Tax=Bacillus smithii TaxID=1479 RepID=UPI0030C9FA3A
MKPKEMVLCGMFVALMAVGANVSPYLSIGGVPVTLQLMFAILAGGILGSRLGALAMTVYVFVGLMGIPVFAEFKGGLSSIFSSTFGFVISFIFVAYAAGKCLQKERPSKWAYICAGLSSLFLNYMIGTNFMYFALTFWLDAPKGFSYAVAWSWMAAYLPLDLIVTTLSLVLVPKLRKALKRQLSVHPSAKA